MKCKQIDVYGKAGKLFVFMVKFAWNCANAVKHLEFH